MKLQGKVAVITGASMGIGEEIAKLFAREGARLVLCARNLARQEEALQRIGAGENAISVACDVSQRDQVQSLAQTALNKFGRIDILVNNAGFGLNDAVAELDVAQCRQLFDTNLFGAMECIQAVVPIMRRQGAGDIVNISSVSGHIVTPYMGAYAASKHAMHAIGMAARMELHEHNINVLTVSPGFIATDFSRNKLKGKSNQRVRGAGRFPVGPEVVARATLNGLLKRKREVVVPRFYSIFIKLHQTFPNLMEQYLRRSMRPVEEALAEVAQGEK
ncbi:MAG TPA: SDR family NAD(P)-dependent oxidoreductase [Candidatus Angelobacter sp.]|jgi:short-subunit dehydrogenase|nr:SDR family NAD(P)-dependent oxidoreductase [Candidatus Angelobacter sp.]